MCSIMGTLEGADSTFDFDLELATIFPKSIVSLCCKEEYRQISFLINLSLGY